MPTRAHPWEGTAAAAWARRGPDRGLDPGSEGRGEWGLPKRQGRGKRSENSGRWSGAVGGEGIEEATEVGDGQDGKCGGMVAVGVGIAGSEGVEEAHEVADVEGWRQGQAVAVGVAGEATGAIEEDHDAVAGAHHGAGDVGASVAIEVGDDAAFREVAGRAGVGVGPVPARGGSEENLHAPEGVGEGQVRLVESGILGDGEGTDGDVVLIDELATGWEVPTPVVVEEGEIGVGVLGGGLEVVVVGQGDVLVAVEVGEADALRVGGDGDDMRGGEEAAAEVALDDDLAGGPARTG